MWLAQDAEVAELSQACESFSGHVDELRQMLDECTRERQVASERCDAAERRVTDLEQRNDEMREERDGLKGQLRTKVRGTYSCARVQARAARAAMDVNADRARMCVCACVRVHPFADCTDAQPRAARGRAAKRSGSP